MQKVSEITNRNKNDEWKMVRSKEYQLNKVR